MSYSKYVVFVTHLSANGSVVGRSDSEGLFRAVGLEYPASAEEIAPGVYGNLSRVNAAEYVVGFRDTRRTVCAREVAGVPPLNRACDALAVFADAVGDCREVSLCERVARNGAFFYDTLATERR